MAKLDVVNLEKKKVGTIEVHDEVFNGKVNVALVHQVIQAQLAARRRGTAKTKTRSEVRGGGKKPFRQKGTGNARQGSLRSPLQPGGGQAHGPVPRSYFQATPKEMVRGALRAAISDRLKAKHLLVVEEFELEKPKTKIFNEIRRKLDLENALIIDDANPNLELSGRNIPNLKILKSHALNVYDIVKYDWLVMSKRAALDLSERLDPGKKKTKAPAAQAEVKA